MRNAPPFLPSVKLKVFFILCLLCSFACSTSPTQHPTQELPALNFTDSTRIELIITGITDTSNVHVSFYQIIPGWTQQSAKAQITSDTSLLFYIKPQQPFQASIELDTYSIPFFVVPGEPLQININTTALPSMQQAVEVSGQQELTAYYLSKADRLGARFWKERFKLQRNEPHLGLLASGLDSLMIIEHDFLNSYSDTVALPAWFVALENAEILYDYADMKISAEGFNRVRLQRAIHVPVNYYDFITVVPVHQPQTIYSPAYLDYLDRLSSHYFYNDSLRGLEQAAKIKGLLHKELPFYDSLFAGNDLLADILKSRTLTRASARLYTQLRDYLDQQVATLKDPLIRQQATAFNQTYDTVIKSGDEAPGFILFTAADQEYSLSHFRDTLVYISFWATFCKPCIEEFPLENELVKKYAQQPVKIISICLDSEEKAWMERINASQLQTLNLFAAGNWNASLKEKYQVLSLPHYVLIDKEGRIIQNKTVRPRDGVDSLIDLHLGLYTRLPDNR